MPSDLDAAERALVKLLRELAAAFNWDIAVTRECSEQELKRA